MDKILAYLKISDKLIECFERDFPDKLPWDFIDTGLNKEWLVNEYKTALHVNSISPNIVPTCEKQCVNCGVCPNFRTHKVMAKPFRASAKAQGLTKAD